jgi:hypothetical protein
MHSHAPHPSNPCILPCLVNNGPGIQFYTLGIGGGCSAYDPPAGFWCSNVTVRFSGFSAEPMWVSSGKGFSAEPMWMSSTGCFSAELM